MTKQLVIRGQCQCHYRTQMSCVTGGQVVTCHLSTVLSYHNCQR